MTIEEARSFLKRGSFKGSKILYAFCLAYEKGVSIDILKFLGHLGEDKNGYYYGYIVCTHAADIISFSIFKNILTIKKFDENLRLIIKEDLKRLIETHDGTLSPERMVSDSWSKDIEYVESYFNE